MKKKNQKSLNQKHNNEPNSSLDDFGLEPPKIYRDSQRKVVEPTKDKKPKQAQRHNEDNLSRNQRRELQTKKRKKRNKLRKILIYFVLFILVASVCVVLSLTVFFHIETIKVTGNERYTTDEILSQCRIDVGENLFLADLESAEETLEKNLPYIYTADISRKFPSSIEIKVTEGESSFFIDNENGTFILLDDNLKVLEKESPQGDGIKISNAKISSSTIGEIIEFEDEKIGDCVKTLAGTVAANDFTEFTELYCNNINDNYLVYQNRITFKLGNCENIESKIYQGLSSCEKLNESSPNAEGTMTISGGKEIYFTEE